MKTKEDLINEVRADIGEDIKLSTVELVINSFVERLIESVVAKEDVNIYKLGVFTHYHRKGRNYHNPLNGELITVPGRDLPKVRFSKTLIDKIGD